MAKSDSAHVLDADAVGTNADALGTDANADAYVKRTDGAWTVASHSYAALFSARAQTDDGDAALNVIFPFKHKFTIQIKQ